MALLELLRKSDRPLSAADTFTISKGASSCLGSTPFKSTTLSIASSPSAGTDVTLTAPLKPSPTRIARCTGVVTGVTRCSAEGIATLGTRTDSSTSIALVFSSLANSGRCVSINSSSRLWLFHSADETFTSLRKLDLATVKVLCCSSVDRIRTTRGFFGS